MLIYFRLEKVKPEVNTKRRSMEKGGMAETESADLSYYRCGVALTRKYTVWH